MLLRGFPRARSLPLAAALAGAAVACDGPPDATMPTPAAALLATGGYHTCTILDGGAVRCWGDNRLGQLGRAAGDDPLAADHVDLGPGRQAVAVYASLGDTCVILGDGAVKCWGDNSHGQLGLGDIYPRGDGTGPMGDALPVLDLGAGRRAVALALGGTATCALFDDGALKCWGDGYQGATGHGNMMPSGDRPETMGDNLPTVDLGDRDGVPFRAREIAALDYHSFCAILEGTGADNSSLKCWGSNDYCELGLGTHDGGRGGEPATLGNGIEWVDLGTTAAGRKRKAIALGGGYQSNCVLGDDGAVSCWGPNGSGQLGNGTTGLPRSCEPGEVGNANLASLPGPAVAIAARGQVDGDGAHACALLATGSMTCWGENTFGQLGTGDTTWRSSPSAPFAIGDGFVPQKLLLGNQHSCAISTDDRIKCWGSNQQGQLGPDVAGDLHAPGPDLRRSP